MIYIPYFINIITARKEKIDKNLIWQFTCMILCMKSIIDNAPKLISHVNKSNINCIYI